jgi:hypothetical protein
MPGYERVREQDRGVRRVVVEDCVTPNAESIAGDGFG